MKAHRDVIPAPEWLRERMRRLRQQQPPTLKEVEQQLKASAATRAKLTANQRP